MYDLTKADEIYNEMSTDQKVDEVFRVFREKMPKEYCALMYIIEYGCHIVEEKLYYDAVKLLKWVENRGTGAKWSVDEIQKAAGIDFDTKDYYLHDFAYVMNMLYSDYSNVFTDSSYYIKMAKSYLEDPDYCDDPSERAYHDAVKRIEYNEKEEG